MQRLMLAWAVGLTVFVLTACDSMLPIVTSVSVNPSSASVEVRQSAQLAATVRDASGKELTGRSIAWASSNPALGTVSATGLVTGVAVGGPVTITATSEGKSGVAAVTILRASVASVAVIPTAASVVVRQTAQLTATLRDGSGEVLTGRSIAWTSSNPALATVSATGLVTGVTVGGPVTITATSEGKSGAAEVTLLPASVNSVTVTPSIASVDIGQTVQLSATLRDATGHVLTGRPITWATSNAALATVSATGLVTGVASGGSVTITATSEGKSGTSAITVRLTCPGGIIGDPAARPTIQIADLQPGASTVRGTANNVDARKVRVVLWALTNIWYVQPFISRPFTAICSDGSWGNSTHAWKRMVALLVDSTYVPGSTRLNHPALEAGVLAWAQVPPPRPDIPLAFSGRDWGIKVAEDPFGPGPNRFSDSPENVWVDAAGLHLRITLQNGRWTSSEVHLLESLGYGEYTVQLASPVDSLDPVAVLGLFVYESLSREFDVEFSRALVPSPNNAQYVVQPYTRSGNLARFRMPAVSASTHRWVWRAGRIEFLSWRGWRPYPPNTDEIIHSWTYTGPDVPPPGAERMRLNLWLFNGSPPATGRGNDVVIRSFQYRP